MIDTRRAVRTAAVWFPGRGFRWLHGGLELVDDTRGLVDGGSESLCGCGGGAYFGGGHSLALCGSLGTLV